MERITRRDCEGVLRRLNAATGIPINTPYPHTPGALMLQDESGVKRLALIPADGRGVSDQGWPGFATWRELWGFLRGMVALAEMRAQ